MTTTDAAQKDDDDDELSDNAATSSETAVKSECHIGPSSSELNRAIRVLLTAALLLAVLHWLHPLIQAYIASSPSPSSIGPPYIFDHLAQYSPYRNLAEYESPPSHCAVDKVVILQRHGARFPTNGVQSHMRRLVDRLHAAQRKAGCPHNPFSFLDAYRFTLGAEDLVPLGENE